jgi:two-component system chemotaxis response regulator CheY
MALNVLIVDDSPMMRNIVGRVLELSGIDIESRLDAENGSEALKVMEEKSVDLVLVDINMPVMNGEELVKEMSRKQKLSNVPVVVISSDGTVRRKERMSGLGVYGYLQKPFRPEELRDEIERIMRTPRPTQAKITEAVVGAAGRVLETMCYTCVIDSADAALDQEKTPLGVSVCFSGSLNGEFELWVSAPVASSLAISSLGIKDDANASENCKAMLSELANMMCGAALSELYPEGEFRLSSPGSIEAVTPGIETGQHIECDDGCIWVSLETRPNRWHVRNQSEC